MLSFANVAAASVRGDAMLVRSTVIGQFAQIAREQNKSLAPLSDDLALADSGFDSLCFAILVAHLEDMLGVDPFNTETELTFPTTLGELIGLYEAAAH